MHIAYHLIQGKMDIKTACKSVLLQLDQVVNQIDHVDYSKPIEILSGSTLGQHIRHTIEFFICLQEGCLSGVVNYDKRRRDVTIEEDPERAKESIAGIRKFVDKIPEDFPLVLEVNYELNIEDIQTVQSNFIRELTYNIEHTVHHMAILKIGLADITPYVRVPKGFGVAVSTLRYRKEQDFEV